MPGGGLDELFGVLEHAAEIAIRAHETERDLLVGLGDVYHSLLSADFSHYDVDEIKTHAPEIVATIFALYLSLRDRIPDWHEQGLMTRPVQAVLRDVFRAARYARDLIGEIGLGHPRLAKGDKTFPGFGGPEAYVELNPQIAHEDIGLRPGDVLLQRGMVHNSAAIARIGDNDSQFSHVSIVARDETGELVIVEALIEEGSIVTPLKKALEHGLGRAILFRHRDPALAAAAAEMIRQEIARTRKKGGKRILYDFTMELAGYRDLYCAKLVRLAYAMASSGEVRLPTFSTRLLMLNRDFVRRIGVTARETFAPGDMELEPDFVVVSEWRDYRVTSELRLKDMIMVKLFEWMELASYQFRPTPLVHLVGFGGWLTARLPESWQEVTRRFVAKVPPNMTIRAISAVAMLHWTAEELFKELAAEEDEHIRRHGRQLHPREVLARLDQMRKARGRRIGYLVSHFAR